MGAYLAWTLIAAEILYMPAKAGPPAAVPDPAERQQRPVNAGASEAPALVQLPPDPAAVLGQRARLHLDMTASLTLVPYLFAAGYALQLAVTRRTYEDGRSLRSDMLIAGAATFYTLFLIWAARLGIAAAVPSSSARGSAVLDGPPRAGTGCSPVWWRSMSLVTLGGLAGLSASSPVRSWSDRRASTLTPCCSATSRPRASYCSAAAWSADLPGVIASRWAMSPRFTNGCSAGWG